MFQRNHLCSHNVGEQPMSTDVLRSIAEPIDQRPERDTSITTLDTPRQTSRGDGNRFKVPNWNIGVSGSRARPCMCARPSSLHGEKSFRMSAPFKRSPQRVRQPDGEAAYTTLRVSRNRMADKMLSRHLATSLQRRSTRYTFCAPLWPSHYPHKCTTQAQNGSSTWRQLEKIVDLHQPIYLNNLVFWTCVVWGNIRRKTLRDRQKLLTLYTSHPAQHKPHTHLTTPETFLNVTKLHVSIGLLDHCYVLNEISLLSDANTIGTLNDKYPMADLDMFVLTTT